VHLLHAGKALHQLLGQQSGVRIHHGTTQGDRSALHFHLDVDGLQLRIGG
jgi:hypothetical protein